MISRKVKGCRNILFFISLLILPSFLTAQTYSYWSWAFNTRSMLVGGAVVGGKAGPSAAYYNPAIIGNDTTPSLSLSASIFSLQSFKAEDIAGEGIHIDKFIGKIQPRFISYLVPSKNEKTVIEMAILTPVSEENSFTVQHYDTLDILKSVIGEENYSGYLKYNRKYQDTWVGVGSSYKLTKNLDLGASIFVSIKNLRYLWIKESIAYRLEDSVVFKGNSIVRYSSLNYFSEEFKYTVVSLITKFGIYYRFNSGRVTLGANVTLPDLPIYGEGSFRKEATRSNIFDANNDEFTENVSFVYSRHNDQLVIKNPLSISIGARYSGQQQKTVLMFTAEYFDKINTYSAFLDEGDANQDLDLVIPGIQASPTFYFGAKSVTNIAIGFSHILSNKLELHGGIRTDFSAKPEQELGALNGKPTVNQFSMDLYHFTLGPIIRIKKVELITGAQYSYGREKNVEQISNYAQPIEYIPQTNQALEGIRSNVANISIDKISLFFGLIVDI